MEKNGQKKKRSKSSIFFYSGREKKRVGGLSYQSCSPDSTVAAFSTTVRCDGADPETPRVSFEMLNNVESLNKNSG